MNLLLLDHKDFTGANQVTITGRRFMHMKKILRAEPGTKVLCGLVNGKMGRAVVVAKEAKAFELSLVLDQDPPDPLPLTLVLALPRPKMVKRIIQSVASLGVKNIYLVNSKRVEKSFWQSDLFSGDKLETYLRLGLEQARDTMIPKIHTRRYFTQFVNQELPKIISNGLCIAAHPKASQSCPIGVNKKMTLVVGPEGGFIDLEIETLKKAGCEVVSLGPRILRVETATTYLISRLFNSPLA